MSATKIGKNTTNILKLLYFTINLHFVPLNQISTYRKVNLPHKQYFLHLLTSRNAKMNQTDQNIPCVFLLCEKKRPMKLYKCLLQKPFSPVCMLLVQLASIFFILCDNWKTFTFHKINVNLRYFF